MVEALLHHLQTIGDGYSGAAFIGAERFLERTALPILWHGTHENREWSVASQFSLRLVSNIHHNGQPSGYTWD